MEEDHPSLRIYTNKDVSLWYRATRCQCLLVTAGQPTLIDTDPSDFKWHTERQHICLAHSLIAVAEYRACHKAYVQKTLVEGKWMNPKWSLVSVCCLVKPPTNSFWHSAVYQSSWNILASYRFKTLLYVFQFQIPPPNIHGSYNLTRIPVIFTTLYLSLM